MSATMTTPAGKLVEELLVYFFGPNDPGSFTQYLLGGRTAEGASVMVGAEFLVELYDQRYQQIIKERDDHVQRLLEEVEAAKRACGTWIENKSSLADAIRNILQAQVTNADNVQALERVVEHAESGLATVVESGDWQMPDDTAHQLAGVLEDLREKNILKEGRVA